MSTVMPSHPPRVGRWTMPVAAHGMVAPVVGFSEAIAVSATPLITSCSPPTMRRLPFGAIALSETRLSALRVERGDDVAVGGVELGDALAGGVLDVGEVAADVDVVVVGDDRRDDRVGVGRPSRVDGAARQVQAGDALAGLTADGGEGAGHVQELTVRRDVEVVDHAVGVRVERGDQLTGVHVEHGDPVAGRPCRRR